MGTLPCAGQCGAHQQCSELLSPDAGQYSLIAVCRVCSTQNYLLFPLISAWTTQDAFLYHHLHKTARLAVKALSPIRLCINLWKAGFNHHSPASLMDHSLLYQDGKNKIIKKEASKSCDHQHGLHSCCVFSGCLAWSVYTDCVLSALIRLGLQNVSSWECLLLIICQLKYFPKFPGHQPWHPDSDQMTGRRDTKQLSYLGAIPNWLRTRKLPVSCWVGSADMVVAAETCHPCPGGILWQAWDLSPPEARGTLHPSTASGQEEASGPGQKSHPPFSSLPVWQTQLGREYTQLVNIHIAPAQMCLMRRTWKDARGLFGGHLCSSKRGHFHVLVGSDYFKAGGLTLSFATEWPPCRMLTGVLPRPFIYLWFAASILIIRYLSHLWREIICGFIFPFFNNKIKY